MSDAEDRAVRALFGDKPFTVNDITAGERDNYAISIPALTRAIEAAVVDERKRCAGICYAAAKRQDAAVRQFANDLAAEINKDPEEDDPWRADPDAAPAPATR